MRSVGIFICRLCLYSTPAVGAVEKPLVCHRYPPVTNQWPLVAHNDWCGEFRPMIERDISGNIVEEK